ncbi:MAG: multicopper oxidase domain-containing protein, partial [Gammaproteobacteria bacterium]
VHGAARRRSPLSPEASGAVGNSCLPLHPHRRWEASIPFHGVHPAEMDSIEPVPIGQSFTYDFDAEPFGLHLYHCHVLPLKRHLHKGLYGGFIVDPKQGRPPAHEMFMLMNGFDTNFDGENEVYAVNTVGFHFLRHPVQITPNELVRVYLVNILEFDLINGFHLHANFFDVYRTGTRLQSNEYTDTIILGAPSWNSGSSTPADTCFMPTSANLPSSAGRACSRCGRERPGDESPRNPLVDAPHRSGSASARPARGFRRGVSVRRGWPPHAGWSATGLEHRGDADPPSPTRPYRLDGG